MQVRGELNFISKQHLDCVFDKFGQDGLKDLFSRMYEQDEVINQEKVVKILEKKLDQNMEIWNQIYKLVHDKFKKVLENVYVDDLFNGMIRNKSILNWRDLKGVMKQMDKDISELEILILLRNMKKEYLENDLKVNQAYYN